MNQRTTVILVLVLAALAGYMIWSGRSAPAIDTTATPAKIAVLQLAVADIRSIAVRSSGAQVLVERDGGGWRVSAPQPGPADTFRVTDVISGLAKLSATQTITPSGQDLAPYGLDKPAYEVAIQAAGGAPATLRLGAKNPAGTATYVQRADAPTIYLIDDAVIDTVERWATDPPLQPTPEPTAPPLTVLPTVPVTPTQTISATATFAPPGPPLASPTGAPLPTVSNPLSITLPLAPTATP